MPARGERRRGDDRRVGGKWNRQPLTEEEQSDQCVTVVCDEPDEMRSHGADPA